MMAWMRCFGRYVVGAALLFASAQVLGAAEADAQQSIAPVLYVVRRGWHIDVGYAKRDLREPLLSLAKQFPEANYFFFGFGDLHYLADPRNQHGPAMLAALWPGPAIILLTTVVSKPNEAFGGDGVVELPASEAQLQSSQDFVWKSLATHEGAAEVYKPGPYAGSYYFTATAEYSAFHTCNTWVAQTLHASAYPIRAQGILFAGQLWPKIRRLQRRLKDSAPQLQGGLVPS